MSIQSSYINFLLFSFLILLASVNISAQDYSYKHYGVEDGLPSSEVYSAFQDSKGYMWFATDAGVSRFNGYEFKNFDVSNGLTDNTVFLITEDHKGRVWFGTFNLKLCYYENDSIYPYKYNDEIAQKKLFKRALLSFYIDENETIWMGFYGEGVFSCDKNGKIKQSIDLEKEVNSSTKTFFADGKIWGGRIRNHKLKNNDTIYTHTNEISFKDTTLINRQKLNYGLSRGRPFINFNVNKINNDYLITFYDKITLLKRRGNTLQEIDLTSNFLKNTIILSVNIIQNYIWICIEGKGVYKYELVNNKLQIRAHFLPNEIVSRVYQDKENGLWFMTLKEGVYYLANENIKLNKINEHIIEAIEIDTLTGYIYIALDDKTVGQLNKLNNKYSYDIISEGGGSLYTLKYNYKDSTLLIGGIRNGFEYLKKGQLKNKKDFGNFSVKSFIIDSSNIYVVNSFGVKIITGDKEIYNSAHEGQPRIWGSSLIKNKDKIWIGTNEGVRVLKDKTITAPFEKNKYLSASITCMERLDSAVFLVGTKSYGVLVIKNDSIINIINNKTGLIGNLTKTIHVDNQKVIWIGTNTGLSRIDYQKNNTYQLNNFTKKHGLASGEIIDICSYKNTIYVATPKGLVEFDKTKINANTSLPNIHITSLYVNTDKRKIKNQTQLTYKESFITIYFEGLNYRSLGEVEYQYRMLGIDSNWTSTTTRMVQYPTLQPGDYIFEVKAKNEDGYWSNLTSLSFAINPPFWLTWWFILTEIVFGLIVTTFFFIVRENQIKKKERAEKKMVELELKALRSQMNPHFIFNTLNSIQNYIALNDFKNSNKYITQFARLIRTVLNLSEKNMITIQEEIDVLKMYMDLERMRFDKQFDYQIKISDEIDNDYDKIPSMLLQPYVENAIWHGLMNKGEIGQIKIEIQLKENYLCCSIEDNGIGRKKAAEISANRKIAHKSVGMSITKERLDLISSTDLNINIIDIVNSVGVEIGTKVIVKIPYKE
ncbi:MAG: histidine kinase [Flavobacteriales bacterium]|nr:histidine kinase [Flavobacteriales bacterium]